jgi:transcriptional regulator with XRE-family HTH domain
MAAIDVISRNCRRFREERDLSMGELGRRTGLSKQTISAIEHGLGNPTVDTLERLAAALDVSTRALLAEMGTETLVLRSTTAVHVDQGSLRVRQLDQAFGSGYVTNAVLLLEANRGPSVHSARGRGALRHCYILNGRASIGPAGAPVRVGEGDFVRFPAETEHVFEAMTPVATLFVCTTAPQLSMAGGGREF